MTRQAGAIYGTNNQNQDVDGVSNIDMSAGAVIAAGAVGSTNIDDWSGVGKFSEAVFLLDVTAASAAGGDTLDVFVDASIDEGATFVNLVHFTTILGNGSAKKEVAFCTKVAAALAAVGTDLNSGDAPRPFVGDRARVRYVAVGTGSFTFKVTGSFKG
jgi:hypothetical protein